MVQTKYFFNENIAIAYGATGACIYDLREPEAKIYRLDKNASEFVRTITEKDGFQIPAANEEFLSILLDNSFLIKSPTQSKADKITTLGKIAAWVEITEKCQLRCTYCYGSFGEKKKSTLSSQDVDLIVDQLSSNGFTDFRLIGGEPLLSENIVKELILKLSSINSARISVYTNGLLLNQEFLTFCKIHNVHLSIGIFGVNDAECMAITGAKEIATKQYKIIELVKASNVMSRLSITRTEKNRSATKEDLARIYNFPTELIREDQVKDVGRATNTKTPQNSQQKFIQKKTFSHKFKSSFIKQNISGGHSCYRDKICITSSLDVHPCVMERSVVYGNLRHTSLIDLLRSGSKYMKASKDFIDTCNACEYRYACFDCRVQRELPGVFFSKSSNCGYNPHTGTWVE